MTERAALRLEHFNPRSPCGERRHGGLRHAHHHDFNPRSPCGERRARGLRLPDASPFQSTLPVRGATRARKILANLRKKFQSTLPVRGATTGQGRHALYRLISIHAPRAGSDAQDLRAGPAVQVISIHAPRAGSDGSLERLFVQRWNFNPRSPCGERLESSNKTLSQTQFQSTLPVRGATVQVRGDTLYTRYFNPRSPCGERPLAGPAVCHGAAVFQSTLPVRGATGRRGGLPAHLAAFQSTLPVRGATRGKDYAAKYEPLFQSTLPVRGATAH